MQKGVTIILLLFGSKSSLACWGSRGSNEEDIIYEWNVEPTAGPGPGETLDVKQNVTHLKDIIDRNKRIVWGGWTPPPEVEKDWRNWLVEYQLKTNKTDSAHAGNRDRLQKEREEEDNWPPRWLGLGEGLGGMAPPPWAFVPKYTGKPDKCNQSPRLGNCKDKKTRWAWNPFLDKCMSYTWSGCGGTTNNFSSKLKCEESCAVPAAPNCDDDSGIPIEEEDE